MNDVILVHHGHVGSAREISVIKRESGSQFIKIIKTEPNRAELNRAEQSRAALKHTAAVFVCARNSSCSTFGSRCVTQTSRRKGSRGHVTRPRDWMCCFSSLSLFSEFCSLPADRFITPTRNAQEIPECNRVLTDFSQLFSGESS